MMEILIRVLRIGCNGNIGTVAELLEKWGSNKGWRSSCYGEKLGVGEGTEAKEEGEEEDKGTEANARDHVQGRGRRRSDQG